MKNDFYEALRKIVFVMLSYIPLGLACGIALHEAGFTPWQSFVMSVVAYTGAGQFAAASMVAQGLSAASILVTVFFLNLRMSLQTSSLLPYYKHKSLPFMLLFAQSTTDEAYGINIYEFNNNKDWTLRKALIASVLAWMTWAVSVYFGARLGVAVNIPTTIVNYVLIAMFISMLVDQLASRTHVWVVLVTILATVLFQVILKNSLSIVLATLLGSGVGYCLVSRQEEKEGEEK